MLSETTVKTLKKGKEEGWHTITPTEEKQAIDDLKKNGHGDKDHFIIAFWLPQKVKAAKNGNK